MDRPTAQELRITAVGRRLARAFPEWTIIGPPLPAPLAASLLDDERELLAAYEPGDWFRWLMDGWDAVAFGGGA